jgi:hypothetical protein
MIEPRCTLHRFILPPLSFILSPPSRRHLLQLRFVAQHELEEGAR